MHWNYRVVKTFFPNTETPRYDIYEVYYDSEGRPAARSEFPDTPHGESLEELIDDFNHYKKALEAPVLEDKDITGNIML